MYDLSINKIYMYKNIYYNMPKKYDGTRKVTILIDESQHKFVQEHFLNLSALVRGLLRGYILRFDANVQPIKANDGN